MLSSKVLVGLEHDWQALFLIHRFGWLRAHEIARFLWPNNVSQSKYGERLMRKLAAGFARVQAWSLTHRPAVFGVAVAALVAAGALYLSVGKTFAVQGLPPALRGMAGLYGVGTLLTPVS